MLITCIMLITIQAPVSFGAEASEELGVPAAVVTGFLPLEQTEFCYEGEPSEEELVAGLPGELDVTLEGDENVWTIPVSWEIVEDFADTSYYFYSVRPVLPEEYVLAEGMDPSIDVPWITVFREPSAEEIEYGEAEPEIPVEDPDLLPPVYTEEAAQSLVQPLQELLAGCFEESFAASSYEEKIYHYLTEKMGLNMAAACGVMTNLYAESGMQPNNLENTYNYRYGLSDKEYTRRVNKGRKHGGRYTSGYGSTRYFTRDYCGYGICQWTSLNRRKALLKYALKKDVSIANLNMQLGFLKKELKTSYPQVWATLKKVPNNATGVYLSAAHFCASFEIPANTNNTAASRARTALRTYWKKYSGKDSSANGTSRMGICGYTYPKHVRKGKGMTVSGHVISNYNVSSVTAKILNAKGKAVYSKTRKPYTTVYSLYNFDNNMLFAKLPKGTYTYVIKVKDTHGNQFRVKHGFKVTKGGETIIVRGCATKNQSTKAK